MRPRILLAVLTVGLMIPAATADRATTSLSPADVIECLTSGSKTLVESGPSRSVIPGRAHCLPVCFNKVSGATLGYFEALRGGYLGGGGIPTDSNILVARDTDYNAFGLFVELEPQRNAAGQVIYHVYKIRDGFSQKADRCFDDDEPAPLSHDEWW